MEQISLSLRRLTLVTAWSISTLLAIAIPGAYFLLSQQYLQGALESQASLVAATVNAAVASDPGVRLQDRAGLGHLLEQYGRSDAPERIRILGRAGNLIAANNVSVQAPVANSSRTVHAAGVVIGSIEVSHSLRTLLLRTILIALCSTGIAAALFFVLRTFPLRVLQRAFQVLEESESKYRSLYETMSEGMALHRVDLDENGAFSSLTVVDANRRCRKMFERSPREIVGSNSFALFGDTFREYLSELLQVLEQGKTVSFELHLPGTEKIYKTQAFSPGQGLIATLFEDVTEYRVSEQQIQQIAYFDSLTGLPNRALLFDRLNQAIARANRENTTLGVLFIDLDRFKSINDTLGHDAGDQLLIELTRRLRRHIRSCDTLGRLGGDEFLVVVANLGDKLHASYVAQNMIDAIQSSFNIKGSELHVTTSIGIALFPDDGSDAETLVKYADLAMYASKDSGRNAFNFFSPFMNQKALMRMEIEAELHDALEREEFFLEFQPIVDAGSETVTAAEALMRWNHPTRGRISPDQFIPLAEETGLILLIGEWGFRHACLAVKSWKEAGLPPVRLSVNVSRRQIQQQNFAEIVENILRETGADASRLEIELSESCLGTQIDWSLAAVFGMRENGISIAIDNFGAGCSSLAFIKTLPIDRIKIDRSFIGECCSDVHDRAIVEAVITMSRKLGVRSVAEGVENSGQARLLRELGCDEIQGYHYYRPLSSDAFEALLRKQPLVRVG